jgi:outer membrane protein TolC
MKYVGSSVWIVLVLMVTGVVARGAGEPVRLDLDSCVERALEVNVSVLKAGYELDQAGNAVITSASTLLPTVSIQSVNSKYEQKFLRQVGDRVEETDKSYNASLSIDEHLSFGGVMGLFESLSSRSSVEHYVDWVKQDVAYVAKQKYLNVLKNRRLLQVAEEALDLSIKRLEKAQALMDVGSAVKSDVLRAQVEVSSNRLDLISARNALRISETEIKHYLSLDDDVELELEDTLETGERSYDLDRALTGALRRRPDILSASETLKARNRAVWSERGGWLPSLSFSWTDRYTGEDYPGDLGTLQDEAEWSWYLAASVDLFDGFYTFSRVRSAKAQRESAEEDLRQSRLDAALEVRKAYYNVEEARQRVEVSRRTVELAEEELRLAEERYRLGGGTMLEQIDSQVALSEARTSEIQALYDYLLSQAQLDRAIGENPK